MSASHTLDISAPRVRWATRCGFFLAGFGLSVWAPLIPYVRERIPMSDATFGLLLLCVGAGSLSCMPLSGMLAVYVGYWIWNWAIAAKGLAHASLYLFLDILMSGVFAFQFLGERFGPLRLLGAAVILLGVHLAAQRLPPEPAA